MSRFPADSESRRTDTRACAIVHYTIDADHWDYKTECGHDVGRDCILELSEDNYWKGKSVQVQIKGTRHVKDLLVSSGKEISKPLEVETIWYALRQPTSFLLMIVDVESETIYYRELHEHFLEHPELRSKLDGQKTVSIRFSSESVFDKVNDMDLQMIAAKSFARDGDGWFYETTFTGNAK